MKPCKIGTGCKDKDGYIRIHKEDYGYNFKHRFVYAKTHNVILTSNDVIMHTCDVRDCIEPTHLVLGTNKDNIQDRHKKNRNAKSEGHGRSILNEDDVREIRRLYSKKLATQEELGRRYGVSHASIGAVVRYETWKDVK